MKPEAGTQEKGGLGIFFRDEANIATQIENRCTKSALSKNRRDRPLRRTKSAP
jgi:hypothetical protein